MHQGTDSLLLDLFQPGQGAPPYLAGREDELRRLDTLFLPLRRALKKESVTRKVPRDAVLIGPRGNGKTALLHTFGDACQAAGADVFRSSPAFLPDLRTLGRWLLAPSGSTTDTDTPWHDALSKVTKWVRKKRWLPRLSKPRSLEVPGLFLAKWEQASEQEPYQLAEWLERQCAECPRVVLVDEAHTLDLEVGRALLNVSQLVRNAGAPFLLVLAGTPNLRQHLHKMKSTFWNRCERIGVGRLTDAAGEAALQVPLQPYAVTFKEDALVEVVAESQCYPYFIQCWGQSLCEVLAAGVGAEQRSEMEIDCQVVEQARPRFDAQRTDYYQDRYQELDERTLLPAAVTVAEFLLQHDTVLERPLRERLASQLDLSEAAARETMNQLRALGYLWEPPGGKRMEAGIPSLMAYVTDYDEPPEPLPGASPPP